MAAGPLGCTASHEHVTLATLIVMVIISISSPDISNVSSAHFQQNAHEDIIKQARLQAPQGHAAPPVYAQCPRGPQGASMAPMWRRLRPPVHPGVQWGNGSISAGLHLPVKFVHDQRAPHWEVDLHHRRIATPATRPVGSGRRPERQTPVTLCSKYQIAGFTDETFLFTSRVVSDVHLKHSGPRAPA
jgi:hypothetical protein